MDPAIRSDDRPRTHGTPAIHSLDHFCLSVPDLAVARHFYTSFGLDVRDRAGALDLYTFGCDHRWATIVEGPVKRIEYLSFGAYAQDLDGFRARLQEEGIALVDEGPHVTDEGLWFHDNDGRLLQIRVTAKSSPDAKSVVTYASSAPGVRGTHTRAEQTTVHPRRLAHILMHTLALDESIAFYEHVLGLRLSDKAEVVAFLHGIHGSDHHLIAFAQSNGTGMHHSSWDVGSIADVGVGAMQMSQAGYPHGWGVGQHVLGSNFFYYVRDPWDSYAEYSCDIDYVPADIEWRAGSFTADNGFYLWAPPPPDDFAHDYEPALTTRRTEPA
ncbi:Metapyrocatechase 2 [Pararobbsia alpina]|uniref:VOC family protein n=1 Tax=Pararobbsia alpina TaxID=621374 RepID=UPI0039A5C248